MVLPHYRRGEWDFKLASVRRDRCLSGASGGEFLEAPYNKKQERVYFARKIKMPILPPLQPNQLYQPCDPEQFGFQTTAELEDLAEIIGQMRAMDAVRFGAGIRREGYNLFVLGPTGMGKRSMVRQFLEQRARDEHQPSDWCYINNFAQPHKPQALRLPPGKGAELRRHMAQLVEDLRTAIPALFESDEYRARTEAIQEAVQQAAGAGIQGTGR